MLYNCGESGMSENSIGIGYLLANVPSLTVARTRADLAKADWIGVSAMAAGLKEACEIAVEHGERVPVVLGGQGALWAGAKQYPFWDVVRGEGEHYLLYVLHGQYSDNPMNKPPDIRKMYYAPVRDLDDLKPPILGKCSGGIPLVTSRGCPFRCAFCSSAQFWGRKPRFHSAEYVIDYVLSLATQYPRCHLLWILDDLATANKKRWLEIARLWHENDLHKRFVLRLNMRADLFTEDMAAVLRDMGTEHVSVGLESGSDRVLKLMNKQTTVADNQRAVDVGNRAGVPVRGFIIRGFPGETDADWRETGNFLARNRGKMLPPSIFTYAPFPGCAAYAGENPLERTMETV